jgi:hypothetical protein
MFVYAGKPAESRQFTRFLQTTTEKHLGVGLGLRDWRQTLLTIMLNITKADFCLPLPEDTVHVDIHRQFNHSARMGEGNYAIQVSEALNQISHTSVASNQRISLLWHDTVGLSDTRAKRDLHPTAPHLPAVGPPPSIQDLVKPVIAAVENACTDLTASTTTAILDKITTGLQGFGSELFKRLGLVQSVTTPRQTPIPIQVHPRLLDCVSALLPRGIPPHFKIVEQAEALQSNSLNTHVLVVMPTGSGKSLTFFGAPLMYPDKLFVVITPLIALTEDLARRLSETTIRGGKWLDIRDPFQAQLVIVSAHEAGTHDFFTWARSHRPRLGRIFIDEAHHIYTSDTYRTCFRLFDMITRLGVPITFLSATVFPRSVRILCHKDQALTVHV